MLSYPAPPPPRKAAPGCNLIALAIATILFLGFMAFLFFLALPFLRLLTSPLMSFYEEGSCTITNSQVETIDAESTEYRPQIAFVLRTIDGRSYQTAGYDWLQLGLPSHPPVDSGLVASSPAWSFVLASLRRYASSWACSAGGGSTPSL